KVVGELRDSNASLSPRERQVLISIAEGKSNKVIARQYNLAESTVKVHLKAVLRKLGKLNRTQAAIWAIEHGLSEASSQTKLAPSSRDDGLPPEPPWARHPGSDRPHER